MLTNELGGATGNMSPISIKNTRNDIVQISPITLRQNVMNSGVDLFNTS